ncbi:hypothetical protein [Burkholderia sp. Ac-20392]|uniref:hypothetical protein n=1 Tax=Burkholderia sp. Ac-20392 TaxID=2703905 RepID=UPI00197CD376|nr:hypothetical protein [Burkholderia sp. Ac-20392]
MITPPLHDLPVFRQVLGMVVSHPDAVTLAMSQLALNPVPVEIALAQIIRHEPTEAYKAGANKVFVDLGTTPA